MKISQLFLILFMSSIPTIGFAQVPVGFNPPELNDAFNVGRVVVFPTVKHTVWYSPTAFSSEFKCFSGTSSKVCALKVFNYLSDEEFNSLKKIPSSDQSMTYFRDIEVGVVSEIDEQMTVPDALQSTPPMLMKTLAMSNDFQYAQAMSRVSGTDAYRLQLQYENEGLGFFRSTFRVSGEWTEDYISIDNTSKMVSVLKELSVEPRSLPEIRKKIIQAIKASPMKLKNFSNEEAVILAYRQIVVKMLGKKGDGRYVVSAGEIDKIGSSFLVVNESQPMALKCTAELVLKKGAAAVTRCEKE